MGLLDLVVFNVYNPKNIEPIPRRGKTVKAKVIEVYDGDTITVLYRYNFSLIRTRIRIKGIDCPELKGAGVQEWEKNAAKKVRNEVMRLIVDKYVKIRIYSFDKYGGRVIGDVFFKSGETLSDHLILMGYAKSYEGGKKVLWTESECNRIINRRKGSRKYK